MPDKFTPPAKGGSYTIAKPGAKPVRTEFTLQPGEKGHGVSGKNPKNDGRGVEPKNRKNTFSDTPPAAKSNKGTR